jgi:hypothetical protein
MPRSRSSLAAVSLVALVLAAAGCGESQESRRRAAQSGAEKYIELVRSEQYAEAYERTFSTSYKRKLELESFARYRQMLAASTGPIRSATLVKASELPNTDGMRLIYALEGANAQQPAFEIIDVIPESDEWKVAALDMQAPGSAAP